MASRIPDLSHIATAPDETLITIPVMAALTSQGISTVWRKLSDDPRYPEKIKLGNRCTRVRLGDVRRLLREGV